ncbi:hypothetical protein ACFRFL_43090 [Streptomyces sp. NPDC056708]|uniref:hypothetical protein n=1 Tax=unclassified Streptomyces TaxID=2593676 RepID=UPI00369CBDD1
MTLRKIRTATALSCAALAGSALLAGCQSDSASKPTTVSPTSAPHGYVEGADETSEQQSRLVLADAGTGTVGVLDLVTGNLTPLKQTDDVQGVRTDGRFAYLTTADAAHIVDSGAWTVDHGDHVHYYRADIRDVGTISGEMPAHIHSDPAVTAVSFEAGLPRLFDREKLENGAVGRDRVLPDAGRGAVVPYKEHLLVAATGTEQDTVEIRNRKGKYVASLAEPCARPRGEAVTRRGVVFGCADGALLVSEEKGTFSAEKIAYGKAVSAAERAMDFRHRAGSTTLAAKSGNDAVWVLDVTNRSWTRIETGPVAAANSAGEGAPLLALGKDGLLTAYDTATNKRTAHRKLLPAQDASSASIEVDTSRAYVNGAASRKIYEIDYNDRLRLARTFPLDFTPTYMVETGR